MLKAGKRTKEWQHMREQLKPRFEAAGITRCEFRYEGCWRDNGLSFAHTKKRRNLRDGELEVVALACIPCHNRLELLEEAVMCQKVLEAIQNRICQPSRVRVTY